MPPRARIYGTLLAAVFLTSTSAAVAQELQVDPSGLDTSGASVQVKRKGRKGADAAPPQAAAKPGAKPAGNGPNRQFGELEGWSPGKAPPKTKEEQDREERAAASKNGNVNVMPSGNVGVGLPF